MEIWVLTKKIEESVYKLSFFLDFVLELKLIHYKMFIDIVLRMQEEGAKDTSHRF